jgi:formate hydrogenlyase subunit 3/multisubunit Na+/H+ antiporter MnhD subunit
LTLLALSERAAALLGGLTCFLLAIAALTIPIDEALLIGPFSVKIGSTVTLLGRNLIIGDAEGPLLAFLFGIAAMWFFGAEAVGAARRLVPMGMMIIGLLIASLAVQPFLYAAMLIEMAALAAIPLLVPQGKAPSRAVLKFLIYQTLGMPCILLAGWLLAGVETSPGDLALTIQATVMLSVGFAFLLAVFPLNDWIPGLMEEGDPYVSGFLLWLLPNVIVVFGLSFLDGYAWLRGSPDIIGGMRVLGLVMVFTAGLWSALERSLMRMLGHAVVAESGLMMLATSMAALYGTDMIFAFFVPRGLGMALWALSLAVIRRGGAENRLGALRQVGRTHPWAGAGLVLAGLSVAGFPLLAGFPARVDVWSGLAKVSTPSALWFLAGLTGLMIGAVRQLTQLLAARGDELPIPAETTIQRGMLGLAMLALVVLGLYPRATSFLVTRLPLMLEHLRP